MIVEQRWKKLQGNLIPETFVTQNLYLDTQVTTSQQPTWLRSVADAALNITET